MNFLELVERTSGYMKDAKYEDMDAIRNHLAELLLLWGPKRKLKDKEEFLYDMRKYQEKINIKEQKHKSGNSKMTDQDIDALARVRASKGYNPELEAEVVVLKEMIDQMKNLMICLNTEAKYFTS